MKTIMRVGASVAMCCFLSGHVAAQTIYSIGQTSTGAVPGVQVQWASNPLDQYDVLTASNLTAGFWKTSTPQSITASNLTLGVSLTNAGASSFFMVRKKDLDAPAISALYPSSNAVAVPRATAIQVQITDVTGVSTGSIVFALNGTNFTLASPTLQFAANILTFTNAAGLLGAFGTTVNVSVAAADVLGFSTTNFFSFVLEVAPVVQTNILVIGSGVTTNTLALSPKLAGMPALQSVSTLQLIGTYTNRLVFAYTGTPSLTVSQLLASADATNIYYRQITSLSNDVPNSQITAFTTDARLEAFLKTASLNNSLFTPEGTNLQAMTLMGLPVAWNALTLHESGSVGSFDMESGSISLSGSLGTWDVKAAVSVSADIGLVRMKSCRIDLTGEVEVNLTPEIIVSLAGSASKEIPLIQPVHRFHKALIWGVPVWLEVIYELNAGAEISASASGGISGGLSIKRDLACSFAMIDNSWTQTFDDTGWTFTAAPVDFQLNGNVNAKVYLQPKITVYVYSLVGAHAAVKPYFSFDGTYQALPSLAYDFKAKAGLDFDVAMDVRFWNPEWGVGLPYIPIPGLIKTLWTSSYPPKAPVITTPPADANIPAGQTASFSVTAAGNPPPTYAWYQNGTLIPWATSPTLAFTAPPQTTGSYQVVVANSYGSTSAIARLSHLPTSMGTTMAFIPAGSFVMGATTNVGHESQADEKPQHTVYVSAFYMDRYEVTKALWDSVYSWAVANGYSFANAGSGKAANHPVHTISWYDCVKWSNARSETEGLTPCYSTNGVTYKTGNNSNVVCNWSANGYRLPTEAEWEKAARGGTANHRFPWSDADTIQHARANYSSRTIEVYDTSPTRGYHPAYTNGGTPYSSPVGSFAANGYGLCDMAGNLYELCWDWRDSGYYSISPGTDPRGPISGSYRVLRGGAWHITSGGLRCAYRNGVTPGYADNGYGFRCVRGL